MSKLNNDLTSTDSKEQLNWVGSIEWAPDRAHWKVLADQAKEENIPEDPTSFWRAVKNKLKL